ncbi:hypothetical protein [Moorena producens]|uniref:hypothetical protein n=1 Tax=Moorena producens TaxID=1155739 RepID=UPI0011EA6493|nr:hypothetical protein [Moorena producens]
MNKDHVQQCPPYEYLWDLLRLIPDYDWVLVGIADLIARRSIKIMFSNAHPTSIFAIYYEQGVGGHCRFNCSPFNKDHV